MKKLLLIGIFVFPLVVNAQYWEFGGFLGFSNYSGELAHDPVEVKETHPAIGGILRYNINRYITLKGNIYYGTISGTDANADNAADRIRNLSFKSNILDVGFNFEVNLLGFQSNHHLYKTSPYLFAGASVFRFNPKAKYNDEWIPLQPLGTEGQGTTKYNDREKYALTQISIPFGLGIKHALDNHWVIGAEFGLRATFTDYLDDVSTTYVEEEILVAAYGQISYELSNRTDEILDNPPDLGPTDPRGNPTTNDWYMFGGLTITYTVIPNKCYKF